MGHTLTDNHNGLVVNAVLTQANGYTEREAAKVMMIIDARQAHEEETTLILGAPKGYDAKEFLEALQEMNVLPHVTQSKSVRKQPYTIQWVPTWNTRSRSNSERA